MTQFYNVLWYPEAQFWLIYQYQCIILVDFQPFLNYISAKCICVNEELIPDCRTCANSFVVGLQDIERYNISAQLTLYGSQDAQTQMEGDQMCFYFHKCFA